MIKLDKITSNKLCNDTFAPLICKMTNVSSALYTINKETNTGFLYVHESETWYFVENYDFDGLHQTSSFFINKR